VLQRSAEINDAWKILRDPWQRARALLELLSPGVLDRNKKLDPAFLAEALELAEEVAFADGDRRREPARSARRRPSPADLDRGARKALGAGDFDAAARAARFPLPPQGPAGPGSQVVTTNLRRVPPTGLASSSASTSAPPTASPRARRQGRARAARPRRRAADPVRGLLPSRRAHTRRPRREGLRLELHPTARCSR
jgi:curved DNA-binding protein CbpA